MHSWYNDPHDHHTFHRVKRALLLLCALAKEPMKHVVALARAEVEENPLASPAMREFAGVRLRDAEKRATRILEKHELVAPIPIDRVKLHEAAKPKQLRNFPCMKFSSWLKFLLDTGRLPSQLCGCGDMASMNAKLIEFWRRYEQILHVAGVFPHR